jgi:hypothetical protein
MRTILLIILFLLALPLSAKLKDSIVQHVDNIELRSSYYLTNEEHQKEDFIRQYAAMLCDSLDYNDPIIILFSKLGREIEDTSKTYLTYYKWASKEIPKNGDSSLIYEYIEDGSSNKIVLRQFAFNFDIVETLELLHYAINNIDEIKV